MPDARISLSASDEVSDGILTQNPQSELRCRGTGTIVWESPDFFRRFDVHIAWFVEWNRMTEYSIRSFL